MLTLQVLEGGEEDGHVADHVGEMVQALCKRREGGCNAVAADQDGGIRGAYTGVNSFVVELTKC